MITTDDESWATDTLKNAQDPGAGHQEWLALSRITLERYNLIFSQQHWRGYAASGQAQHDAGTVLENSLATLFKLVLVGGELQLTKWSVANGLAIDAVTIVADADISDTARPSLWLGAGASATVTVFYVDEDEDYIHYIQSGDGGFSFGAEQDVSSQSKLKAIAATSAIKVHAVSYTDGNSRFHCYEDDGGWSATNSLLYWPHRIEHIDAITIGDRDLVVFYSPGPMYGAFREAGVYGLWYKHGRWSELFKIDVLDETDDYSYRKEPMISVANGIYFLTGYLSEGDDDYSHAIRFLKTSKDGQNWSQYQPLVTCPEAGPAKLLVINAVAGQSWPWSTGQQVYLAGYSGIFESDATRLVGEENADLQVDVSSRTEQWTLTHGVVSQATTVLGNQDGILDAHAIINAENSLLCKREAGYRTDAGDEYAQLALEQVDFIKETDRLPKRHKQVVSRDFMAWLRDNEANHFEEWESQLVGYDNYHDDTETGYGGLGHTATQSGWWETTQDMLWLNSDNEEGIAFATWDSRIMNGQVKAMIRIETSGNDEYAGVIFRAHGKDNFLCAYYDEATDKILLRHKYNGSWRPSLASSSVLSWSIDTWYGVKVDFRYSYIRVFYSTDGLTWTEAFTHVISQDASGSPPEYGYVGLIGYGYSDKDEGQPPGYTPPEPPPGPGPENLGPMGPAVASHSVSGFYYTGGWGDEWEQRNDGLLSTDILDLIWDPWWFTPERQGTSDPEQAIFWACGAGWVAKKVGAGNWADVTPNTDPPNTWSDATPPTTSTVTYKQLHGCIHNLDTFYVLVEWQEPDSGDDKWRGWIAKTTTNGLSWTWYAPWIAGAPGQPAVEPFGIYDTTPTLEWAGDQVTITSVYHQRPGSPDVDGWGGGFYCSPRWKWNLISWDNYSEDADYPYFAYILAVVGGGPIYIDEPEDWDSNQCIYRVTFESGTAGFEVVVELSAVCDYAQVRPLAFDVDTDEGSRIYVTIWADGGLHVNNLAASDLTLTATSTFGVATEPEVADKTYFIVPRCPHSITASGFGDYVWVFGRYNDGSEKLMAYSTDGAATFTDKNEGTWDSNHRIGAIDVLYDLTTIWAFVNHASTPRLWKSINTGGAWTNINSIPFNVEFESQYRANWSEDEEFLIGRNEANAQMAAWNDKDYSGSWQDCTGSPGLPTASGYISAIIWV